MKKYFWMIAIVTLIGLFTTQSANAEGHRYGRGNKHHAQKAYRAGYHNGARDAYRYDRRYGHRGGYYGHHRNYYGHRNYHPHYRRSHYYAPRPVVRVSVPLPPHPRVVIHN